MKKSDFAALCAGGPVLLDGATGTNLIAAGMSRGVCTEQWIAEHPQPLLALQRAYAAAGSQIIYAPTFSANRRSLARHGLGGRVRELNATLVALSRQAVGAERLVAGDMTTTGEPLEPLGTLRWQELFDLYREQAEALADAGVDLLVVETMLGIDETVAAVGAAQEVCDLPVLCSLTVQADGSAYFGGNCIDAVRTLQSVGADAVGVNCSFGPEQLGSLVRGMRAATELPLLVKPNAGLPVILENGEAVYPMGPEEFARHMLGLVRMGATLIGGCCGTTPEYIAALRAVIEPMQATPCAM